jgi:hypothetical protein
LNKSWYFFDSFGVFLGFLGEKLEVGSWKTEDRRPKTGDGRRKTGDRRPETGDEERSWELGVGSWKLELYYACYSMCGAYCLLPTIYCQLFPHKKY